MSHINALNPTQQEAVLHADGPLLIFAGAGSGKTRVLTYRVAQLIENGIDPYHIIAITFTNKATKEMRERITTITPLGEHVWVSTFHSACTRILRRELGGMGLERGFTIYDDADSMRLVKECISENNLSDAVYPPRYVLQTISAQKNELITPEEYERRVAGSFRESNIAGLYALYQKKLKESNALDFDDIIFNTVKLLQNNEEILAKYQNRFRYVMVDEYQDTNHAQYELVRLLSGYAKNICVVGDDDQSIYGWRGADIRNILQFEKDYPGTKVIKLEQNYRSTNMILSAANDVIKNNETRAEKHLWTDNDNGERVSIYEAKDQRDEGAFVARIIEQEVRKGKRYSDFAVLYRNNFQSRGVEDQLVGSNIAYRIFGGTRFYDRMEVKDILAYLKAINNPADLVSHLRIINTPKRGIGAATLKRIQEYALSEEISISVALAQAASIPNIGKKKNDVLAFSQQLAMFEQFSNENSVAKLIEKILHETGYLKTINDGTPEGKEREDNVMELLATTLTFEYDSDDTSLGKFLEDVALVADIDKYEEDANAVSLMTLHSSKGLEFNTVFLVGFEENLFPSSRSIGSGKPEELEEERRLCYVGFTRAKKSLYLVHAISRMQYNNVVRNPCSRFFNEVSAKYITSVNMMGKPKERVESSATRLNFNEPAKTFTHEPIVKSSRLQASQNPQVAQKKHPSINPQKPPIPAPKDKPLNFKVGDKVRTIKYGIGEVIAINPAGADYEVTIQFESIDRKGGNGEKVRKKFMANLLKVTKI